MLLDHIYVKETDQCLGTLQSKIRGIATIDTIENSPSTVVICESLENSSRVTVKLIQYVKHSLEKVVITDN